MRTLAPIVGFVTLAALAGCTKETPAPPLAGPSGYALQLIVQSVPDSILQDGTSQSVIQIEAVGPDGRPARALALRIEMAVNGVFQDYGTLSSKTVVTGEDGRARVTYTAPPRPPESTNELVVVTFFVTPIGNDHRGETPRTVDLRLVQPGIILPPNDLPGAAFTFNPSAPSILQDIVFDASTTVDGPANEEGERALCGASCTYTWDFGDGTKATGIFVTHRYQRFGVYVVRMTATDGRGGSDVVARAVSVGQGELPVARFTFSPTPVETSQVVFFNAESSTAAPGRRLVAYDWDFGSGRTGTGITTSKSFDNPGEYTVTLVVTDDAGNKGTVANRVTVGQSEINPPQALSASLVVTPPTSAAAPGTTATTFLFDASASRGPSRITEYRFNFGDGSAEAVTSTPTWSYRYSRVGIFNAFVEVKDVTGRTQRATVTIHVTQ
jgi:PKD repeat protein